MKIKSSGGVQGVGGVGWGELGVGEVMKVDELVD